MGCGYLEAPASADSRHTPTPAPLEYLGIISPVKRPAFPLNPFLQRFPLHSPLSSGRVRAGWLAQPGRKDFARWAAGRRRVGHGPGRDGRNGMGCVAGRLLNWWQTAGNQDVALRIGGALTGRRSNQAGRARPEPASAAARADRAVDCAPRPRASQGQPCQGPSLPWLESPAPDQVSCGAAVQSKDSPLRVQISGCVVKFI